MELSMNTNVLLLCCWFRTSITRHVACYPGQLTCYPGINPRGVRAAAACSPRDNSDQGIVKVVLECDEGTPAVTLARVPDVTDVLGSVPRKVPGRADHVVRDVPRAVLGSSGARRIGHGGHCGLVQDDRSVALEGSGAPPRHHGGHSVIVSGGVRQTRRHHPAGEGQGGGELDEGEVIVIALMGGVRDPGARGDGDLAVTGVSVVMLAHNHSECCHVYDVAVGGCEDGVVTDYGSSTKWSHVTMSYKRYLPGILVLVCCLPSNNSALVSCRNSTIATCWSEGWLRAWGS